MRRIFTDTTAIALCLGLGLPQVATAETLLPAGKAAQLASQRATNMPRLAKVLQAELAGGLAAGDLRCQMNAPRPCPDGMPMFTPGGLAVEMGEDGTILLAPKVQQTNIVGPDGTLVPDPDAPLRNVPRAAAGGQPEAIVLAQADAAPVVLPPVADAGQQVADDAAPADAEAGEQAQPDAAAAAADAAKAERRAAAQAEAEAAAQAAAAAAPAPAPAPAEPQEDAAPDGRSAELPPPADAAPSGERADETPAPADADAAAAATADAATDAPPAPPAPADAEQPAAEATADRPVESATPPAPPTAPPVVDAPDATPDAAPDRADAAPDAAALAEALARQNGEAVPPSAPPVVAPPEQARSAEIPPAVEQAPPADTPVVAAPAKPVQPATPAQPTTPEQPPVASRATPAQDAPVVTAAPDAPAQDQSPDALARALEAAQAVPEARAQETAAAREAAEAAPPAAAAAALAEAATPVTSSEKTTVTQETSRQATEDFATDLRGTPRPDAQDADVPATPGTGPGAVVVDGGQTQPGGVAVTPAAPGANPVVAAPVVAGGNALTEDDDDDDNLVRDIARIGLPVLAGLVAGQMLSNNRQVALNTGDRVVVERPDGSYEIIKDDNALLARPGSTVQTEEYADGSTRTIVAREDGTQVVTIRDADLRILRRTLVYPDGSTTALIDDTQAQPVVVSQLPAPAQPVVVTPGQPLSEEALREALRREVEVDRSFSLGQIRAIPEVRALVAPVDIQAITFDTGSAAIKSDQAQQLATLGRVITDSVRQNPREMFLIEGHTDAVGSGVSNLALSDRRAESVALALTEFFDVPPENMVVQGYGEQFLKIPAEGDIRENRRAAVRRITDLLARN